MRIQSAVIRALPSCLIGLLCGVAVRAATFEVTNLSDSGVGSLRERIALAAANAGPDTITFRPDLKGVIVLTSALVVNGDLSIMGPGSNIISISGNNAVRVLEITNGSSNITIEGLTLRDGRASQLTVSRGGNIHSVGSLTLRRCVVTNGVAPANTAAYGGGIYHSGGTLELDSCTIHGNMTTSATAGYGAGVYLASGSSMIATNCTIAGNSIVTGTVSWGGGVFMIGSTAQFTYCTFAYNTMSGVAQEGGALLVSESLATIGNSLLANSWGGNVVGSQSQVISHGNNVVTDNSTGFVNGIKGDVVNIGVASAMIGTLGDYGGPTPTVALLPGSPAIDKIPEDDEVVRVDQRGMHRADGDCGGALLADSGAFEYGAGRGINLNGNDQCARVPFAPQFSLANNFTIEAIVRPDHTNGVMRIVSTRGRDSGFGFGHIDGKLIFTTFSIKDYVTSTVRLTPGVQRHVAVVFSNANFARFYVDGAHVQTIAGTTPANTNQEQIYIGRNPPNTPDGQYWDGQIDEVRIWNLARTASQIAASYNTELTGNEPGLIGYWRFNEGHGDISANDAGAGGYGTAELLKGPYWMQAPACLCDPCDTNCNGTVNQFDIVPFVKAVTTHTGCSPCTGDVNGDGTTNTFDIGGFLNCLVP